MKSKFLDLYTDYLIGLFGPVTATGLLVLLDGTLSHDQITGQLSQPAPTSADIWRSIKSLIRQYECDDPVLVVDDSIAEKAHTDENELTFWHYDNTKQRSNSSSFKYKTC